MSCELQRRALECALSVAVLADGSATARLIGVPREYPHHFDVLHADVCAVYDWLVLRGTPAGAELIGWACHDVTMSAASVAWSELARSDCVRCWEPRLEYCDLPPSGAAWPARIDAHIREAREVHSDHDGKYVIRIWLRRGQVPAIDAICDATYGSLML